MTQFKSLHLHAPSTTAETHITNDYSTENPKMTNTGDTEDIMRYIYQHAFYDAMPEIPQHDSHDHNALYNYETNYIGHSIYEDVSKTMQLFCKVICITFTFSPIHKTARIIQSRNRIHRL